MGCRIVVELGIIDSLGMIGRRLHLLERGSNSQLLSFGEGEDRVVLKVVSSLNKKEQRHLRSEFQMLSVLTHPHIISPLKYQELIADPTRTPLPPTPTTHPHTPNPHPTSTTSNILVLQFAPHGSLLRYLHTHPLSLSTARRFFHQIASALHYCHSRSIAHRDLKLDNILVFQQGGELSVKVSDFGFAERCVKEGKKVQFGDYKGTRKGYMAPQIHVVRSHPQKTYDALKADIFALGVLLFALLFKKMPFQFARQDNRLYSLIKEGKMEEFWSSHSEVQQFEERQGGMGELRGLFEEMVQWEGARRPSAREVLKHGWLAYPFE